MEGSEEGTGEGIFAQQVRQAPGTVPARVEADELMSSPGKRLICLEGTVDGDGFYRWLDIACAVNRKRVAEAHVHFAEVEWMLEERTFNLRCGDFRPAFAPWAQFRRALALLAVMMREQHPLDALDANLV